jgi:uncharacterized heparinase superfamily protein
MDRAEIVSRARREPARLLDDVGWRAARPLWRRGWSPKSGQLTASAPATRPLGFLTRERADALREYDAASADAIVAAAARVVEGRFQFFGYPEVRLARPLEYARDPWSGRQWPPRYGPRLDYRHSDIGDPKWIWELNRCQHIPLLVAAWLLSENDHFAETAVADVRGWIDRQGVGRGIAWANGFEAALRAISLAVAFDGLRGVEAFDRDLRSDLLLSLWQHVRWIRREPSEHSSANNHRIGELAGLAVTSLLVPELTGSADVERRAVRELEHELDRQILADGTSAEQAFAYHLFVLDLLLVVAAAYIARALPLPSGIDSALARSADALALQLGEDEPAPTYGDTDDSRALRLDGDELRDAHGIAAGLAALLGHGGARRVAGRLDAAAFWLFGREGLARFSDTEAGAAPASAYLPDAGLVVLRSATRRALFDVGPLGFGSLAAHGHADALQVTLVDDGSELIVDPGVGSFFAEPKWRRAFRGTAFHATVTVDGVDQSEPGGPFLWQRHAVVRVREVDLERGFAIADHAGYMRLADPVRHTRAVVVLPDGMLLVIDRLDARQQHEFVQTWPLHPSLEATQDDAVINATLEEQPRLLMSFAASVPGRAEVVSGRERPLAGWWSARLQARVPAWHCSWSVTATGPVTLAALLVPLQHGPWPDAPLSLRADESSVTVTLDGDADRQVEVSFDEPLHVTATREGIGAPR